MYHGGTRGDPGHVVFGFQGSWGRDSGDKVLESLRSRFQGRIWSPGHALEAEMGELERRGMCGGAR